MFFHAVSCIILSWPCVGNELSAGPKRLLEIAKTSCRGLAQKGGAQNKEVRLETFNYFLRRAPSDLLIALIPFASTASATVHALLHCYRAALLPQLFCFLVQTINDLPNMLHHI